MSVIAQQAGLFSRQLIETDLSRLADPVAVPIESHVVPSACKKDFSIHAPSLGHQVALTAEEVMRLLRTGEGSDISQLCGAKLQLGRFACEVVDILSSGDFAKVLKIVPFDPATPIANYDAPLSLKIYVPDEAPERVASKIFDAHIAPQLEIASRSIHFAHNHLGGNAPKLYDLGLISCGNLHTGYMVTDFVVGETLEHYLREASPAVEETSFPVFSTLAVKYEKVLALAEHGLIHNDFHNKNCIVPGLSSAACSPELIDYQKVCIIEGYPASELLKDLGAPSMNAMNARVLIQEIMAEDIEETIKSLTHRFQGNVEFMEKLRKLGMVMVGLLQDCMTPTQAIAEIKNLA